MSERYPHTRSEHNGRHYVENTGELRMKFVFEARKCAALYLRINDVPVATEYCRGNLSAKIAHARELLARCESDAHFLQDLVDRAIMRKTGKRDELYRHAQTEEEHVQLLRKLEL